MEHVRLDDTVDEATIEREIFIISLSFCG